MDLKGVAICLGPLVTASRHRPLPLALIWPALWRWVSQLFAPFVIQGGLDCSANFDKANYGEASVAVA